VLQCNQVTVLMLTAELLCYNVTKLLCYSVTEQLYYCIVHSYCVTALYRVTVLTV